jgi:hypothetical protein
MGMLAEQLRSIIEGPLGTDGVSEETVRDRVGAVRQHERRHVFGVPVYRDGADFYYTHDETEPLGRRDVVEEVLEHLALHGRLLDERMSLGAIMATKDQQKAVDDAEEKIGQTFKKLAKRYTQALNQMTGANWKVVSASESIFSLDSDESPKRAIDIYWEYDPGSMTAAIYVEGPKGKQKVYNKQRLADIPKKNYIDWLSSVLKEDMEQILSLALTEDEEDPEPVPAFAPEPEPPVVSEASEETERQSLMEEIQDILDEAAVAYRRSVSKHHPMHVGAAQGGGKKKSADKVADLFKELVAALTSGGDWDAIIKALRKEGVSEKQINFAIRRKQVPFAYSEDVDEELLPDEVDG